MIHENKQYAVMIHKVRAAGCNACDLRWSTCDLPCLDVAKKLNIPDRWITFKLVGKETK